VKNTTLRFVAISAALLVLLRSFLPTFYESYFFDSDQAIVGLMARHLNSGHDFPLYYYGLNYLLGVQAWLIAPVFALLRPTVLAMRVPLVALNILVAVWLIALLTRRMNLHPVLAFVAALPWLIPTPAVAANLVEAAGASIEPFVYVLALWLLRKRSFLFGLLFGLAVLHREFVMFAVPALVLADMVTGELWTMSNVRRAAIALCGAALVWLVIDDLKMHLSGASVGLQAASLRGQTCVDGIGERIAALTREALPMLYGGRSMSLQGFRIDSPAAAGFAPIAWLVLVTLAFVAVRIAQNIRRIPRDRPDAAFGIYLFLVGLFTAGAYPLSCHVTYGGPPILRYLLFGLLIPVGLFATYAACEPSRRFRSVATAAFVLWGAANLVDNVRLIALTARTPPLAEHRVLTDYLLSRQVRYTSAIYWDAYIVSFLSRERIIVASNDVIRIPEYQKEVEAHAADAVNLQRQPCTGFATVASWCLQR